MRLIIDSLIALMLVGILGAVLVHHRHEQQRTEQHRQVHEALSTLYEQTLYHSVLDPDLGRNLRDPLALNRPLHQFPDTVDPAWFEGVEPRNAVAGAHPWIDVAPEDDEHDHPPDPVLHRPDQAGFWYNPSRGIFRARVPAQITDEATLELYNRLNNCTLPQLPQADDPARRPTIPLEMQLATLRRATAAKASGDEPGLENVSGAAGAASVPAASHRPALLRAADATLEP